MISLDKRLQIIYDMVRPNSKIIDVGTDHGHLITKLILDKKCPSGKCIDINLKCLNKAKHLAYKYNIIDKINFSNSDGLTNVNEQEADDIVIAGMGSELISNIINNCHWLKKLNNKHLILQPMNKPWLLRQYLNTNGFMILTENLTSAKNLFYVAIKARFVGNNKPSSSLIENFIGQLIVNKNKYTKNYFLMLYEKFDTISKQISLNGNDLNKSSYYKKISNQINSIISNL